MAVGGTLCSHTVLADLTLKEIVVTAQKREQPLQEQLVAATATSGDMIAALGIAQIEDILLLSPSLNATAGIRSTWPWKILN